MYKCATSYITQLQTDIAAGMSGITEAYTLIDGKKEGTYQAFRNGSLYRI